MQVARSDFFSQSRTGKSVEHVSCSYVHLFDFSFVIFKKHKGWTPHHCILIQTLDHFPQKRVDTSRSDIDPNVGPLPPGNKIGVKIHGWENEVGREKTKIYTHNFVSSRPPTSFLKVNIARCNYSVAFISSFFLSCTLQHVLRHVNSNVFTATCNATCICNTCKRDYSTHAQHAQIRFDIQNIFF